MKSLKAQGHRLASEQTQVDVLEHSHQAGAAQRSFPLFADKLAAVGLLPLKPTGIEIFQMNIGKMCNQTCKHCHVDAGPDRKEIMTRETMQMCLEKLKATDIPLVDLTGGAPEMNPNFRWLVEEITKLGRKTMVRCNLTIIMANKKYHDLPEFYKAHQAVVVSSLPYYTSDRTDRQRGDGVFAASIAALQMLNEVGYGKAGTGLELNLVYNPAGAFFPPSQTALEREYKDELMKRYGIVFNNLIAITNMPISRFLDFLLQKGLFEEYMEKLVNAFNPSSAAGVMCRNTISIGWDGYLYDCDFNQMLGLRTERGSPQHISDFDLTALNNRSIVLGQHCFGCTAGQGSSCGGATA